MNIFNGIKLRQLQYFLAAAEKMHFSKAAEKVFVTLTCPQSPYQSKFQKSKVCKIN